MMSTSRLFRPWFPRLPLWLGSLLEALIMVALLAAVNLGSSLGSRLPLLVAAVLVYAFFSYGARVMIRKRIEPGSDNQDDVGDQDGPGPDSLK